MFQRTILLCLEAATLVATGSADAAPAQPYRPDADGYPCSSAKRVVASTENAGFSIVDAHRGTPAERSEIPPSHVPLGARVKLDQALFEANAVEAADASRR